MKSKEHKLNLKWKDTNAIWKAVYKDMEHNDYLESNIHFNMEVFGVNMNTKCIGRFGIEQQKQSV
jgi:hypothetical protein